MSDISGITCIAEHPKEMLQWHKHRLEFHMTFMSIEMNKRLESGMCLRSCLTSDEKNEIINLETALYQAEENFDKMQCDFPPLQLGLVHPAARQLYKTHERSGLQLTKP